MTRASIKSLVKRVTPDPLIRWHVRRRTELLNRQYQSLNLSDTFDRIYVSGAWGGVNGELESGIGSSERYVKAYCVLLERLISEHGIRSLADLGCGDFKTGRWIARMVSDYTGIDVSQRVIDINTRLYGTGHVKFARADVTADSLPHAEAAIVRQVLQHLSNSEIQSALNNIIRTYPLIFVTEHVYIGRKCRPNLEMGHGAGTRVPMNSGVFLDQPPFNLAVNHVGDIEYAPLEVLRTWVVKGVSLP